jgi:hypothetical protein
MLSEDNYPLPIFGTAAPERRRRLAGLGRAVSGFLGRLASRRSRISDLPDDLYCDVGLLCPAQEREDAFWQAKRLSAARNMSL